MCTGTDIRRPREIGQADLMTFGAGCGLPVADIRISCRLEIGTDHCIAAAIFSADIRVGKLVLAQGTTGKIEASTTRRPWTPLTRP
jgi:hypothetical protein